MNSLDLMRQQSETQLQIIDELKKTRNDIDNVMGRVEFLEKTIPLNRGEAFNIKNQVQEKYTELAKVYFGRYVSKKLYGMKKTHFSMAIYHLLKRRFQATSYTTVLHVDYEKAIEFIKTIEIFDLPPHYLNLTDKQYETNLKLGDGLPEDFRGAHNKVLKLNFGS